MAVQKKQRTNILLSENGRVETVRLQFERVWGRSGAGEGQFMLLRGIAVARNGNIYVCDGGDHRIQYFDSDGLFRGHWRWAGGMSYPSGIAIDERDDICFSMLTAMQAIPVLNSFPPGLLSICAAYVKSEYVNVVEYLGCRVQQFDGCGTFIRKWGSHGSDDGLFLNPYGCAVGDDGIIYVCDTGNHRIQVFSRDGTFMFKIGEDNSGSRILSPMGITVNSGLLYITSTDCVLRCMQSDGVLVRTWPRASGRHWTFTAVVVVDKMVYVVNQSHNRIYQFREDGPLVRKLGADGAGDGCMSRPAFIAKGPNGMLYITDSANYRIVAILV